MNALNQYNTGLSASGALADRPETEMDRIQNRLRDASKNSNEISHRLVRLLTKLRGPMPPSGESSTIAAVPNGTVAELNEILESLELSQTASHSVMDTLEAVI